MVALETRLGAAMNAEVVGSGGETMVLAHGFGADQSVWDKVLPFLTQHYRVVVFDWSFSGAVKDPNLFDPSKYASYDAFADDLIALMDELHLEHSVFVGHSMSGMIGCIASIKRPQLFTRLVLVAASPRYINMDDYEGGFDEAAIDGILSSIESDYENWTSTFPTLTVDNSDPASVEKLRKCLKRMRHEIAVPLAKMVFRSDERDILDEVTTPCTIVQTTSDVVVPGSVADYMQRKIKGKSTVEIVNTNGHFPQLTAHLEFLAVLAGVLGFEI
ncbi:strigolactone esterase D14-like [Hibiscus syriacus]|uniref:strigolactone esterase D14-like n=1 Tax=Hibiscus syriacus TaxID=106335 RepID=UPI001920F4E7|nr:strigolactone esterase D14-like [Hibiscus syriacus]